MAGGGSDSSDGSDIFWPGYVDATTNLILNLLFLLTILIVAVFMFALELGRAVGPEDANAQGKVVAEQPTEITDPQLENEKLRSEIERLKQLLAAQSKTATAAAGESETATAAAGESETVTMAAGESKAATVAAGASKTATGAAGESKTATVAAGESKTATGAAGESKTANVAAGASQTAIGAAGASKTATVAAGESQTATVAAGESQTATGAAGESQTATGAAGESLTATGAAGESQTATGAAGESQTATGAAKAIMTTAGEPKTVEGSLRIKQPEKGLGHTQGNEFAVMVKFKADAVRFTPEEQEKVLKELKPLAEQGAVQVVVEVPAGFSEAKRMGFYRALAVRNLFIKLNVPASDIDVSVVEGDAKANAAVVKVRSLQ